MDEDVLNIVVPNPILDIDKRAKNMIILHDDYAEILLCDAKGNISKRTTIDLDDVDKVSPYRWFSRKDNRVVSNVVNNPNFNSSHIRLHTLIMGLTDFDLTHKLIDHKDKNPLNNRKSNLRIVNAQENLSNRNTQSNSKTGVSGVIVRDSGSKYCSQIKYKRKMIRLIYTNDFDLAVKTRLIKEAELFGIYSANYSEENGFWEIKYTHYDTKEHKSIIIKKEDLNNNQKNT